MKNSKPREFWLYAKYLGEDGEMDLQAVDNLEKLYSYAREKTIHVIEHSAYQALAAKLEKAREALKSVASKNKPRHESHEYWLGISHTSCAEVLANDTKLARQTLAELGDEGE